MNDSERYEELENPTMLPAYVNNAYAYADVNDDDDDSGYVNPDLTSSSLHYNSAYETIA